MRIQIEENGDRVTFQIEGRLAGAWVPELELCWHASVNDHPDRGILVDLSGVTCVDQAAKYLLRLMRRDGVRIIGAGLAIQETLNDVAGNVRKGH